MGASEEAEVLRLMEGWVASSTADRRVDDAAIRALVTPDFVFRLHTGGGDRTIDGFIAMVREQAGRGTEVVISNARSRVFDGGGLLQDTVTVTPSPGAEPVRIERCFVFTVADGRLALVEEYLDPTPMRAPRQP